MKIKNVKEYTENNSYTFKKSFIGNGSTFSAVGEAERWCMEKGICVGVMCRNEPRGLLKGTGYYIHKWYNLTSEDKNQLGGVMVSDDFRDGEVTICLKQKKLAPLLVW